MRPAASPPPAPCPPALRDRHPPALRGHHRLALRGHHRLALRGRHQLALRGRHQLAPRASRPRFTHRMALLVLLALALLPACAHQRYWANRAFFAAGNGVEVGQPLRAADGAVFLPLRFRPASRATRRHVKRVEAHADPPQIVVRALVTLPGPRWEPWDGEPLPLGPLPAGAYDVVYLQPDGEQLLLTVVQVPR